jgi:F420-dependent oxidoreductase-like protein
MRLALNLRYLAARGGRPDHDRLLALTREAEFLGYSVIWTAENNTSDAPSLLSWLAAQTTTIELGSAVLQIPARSPALTAMTAATVDALSGGRLRLGLGVSGPQVAEGWHGTRFARPLARTREYVELVRRILRSDGEPIRYEGEHYQLPLPDGPGKPLRLGFRPVRPDVPIYLGAVGPRNLELAGEIADGWLSVFFQPETAAEQIAALAVGRARTGADMAGFDVAVNLPAVVGDDFRECIDPARAYTAHYLGGMGSRAQNFYNRHAVRMGYGDAARETQDHYLAGRIRSAIAAVPDELVDRTALLGPVPRIADRMHAYAEAGVTTLAIILLTRDVDAGVRTLRAVAQAFDKAGIGN